MAEGFEEWQGTVTIEVQIAVRAARSEHVEPDEVAAGTAELLRAALKDSWGDDIRLAEVRATSAAEGHWTDWR
jgi:hypothetical protein